jgi:hypothetical protein
MSATLKEQAVQKAVRAIVRLLPSISEENLLRLVTLGKRLTDDEEVLQAIDTVRDLLQVPQHPAKQLFYKVLTYLPPERRIRLFETLFNRAWFKGGKLRDAWEATLGFRLSFLALISSRFSRPFSIH